MDNKYYVIKHQGMYIKESVHFGEFDRTPYIKQAIEFTNIELMQRYIQDELKLNLANVTVAEIKTITTTTNLILFNGEYVDRATVEFCTECDTLHLIKNMQWYRTNNVDKPEIYCEECYDELDSNYPNVIGNQMFDEESV